MRSIVNMVIVMALATQVSHAAWLFNDIGKPNDGTLPWMGWVFALSLEASIFVFTIYEKRNVATFFAVVSTLVNLLYYWIEVSLSHRFFAMLVISPIVPTTIWYYSDLIALLRAKEEEDPLQGAPGPIGGYYPEPAAFSKAPSVPAESAPVFVASVPDAPKVQDVQVAPKPVGNGNAKPKRPAATRKPRTATGASQSLHNGAAGQSLPVGSASDIVDTPRSVSDVTDDDWQILDDDAPSDWRERTGV